MVIYLPPIYGVPRMGYPKMGYPQMLVHFGTPKIVPSRARERARARARARVHQVFPLKPPQILGQYLCIGTVPKGPQKRGIKEGWVGATGGTANRRDFSAHFQTTFQLQERDIGVSRMGSIYGHIWPPKGPYIPYIGPIITRIPIQRCSKVGQNMRFMTNTPFLGYPQNGPPFWDPQNSALARARARARACARARSSGFPT